jgi:Zn-finger nucleic acid-binding protein
MICPICGIGLDLFDLTDYEGVPCHRACRDWLDREAAAALAEAEAMIRAEADPRRHRSRS